jgi:uncharacterized protein
VVFGQSLGGSTALVVMAKEPLVKAGVIEAAFATHAGMARALLGRHVWTWPLYPILPLFVDHQHDPIRYVDKISPRPLFFIHGTKDKIVPVGMSRTLFEKAKEPKKLWIVPGAGHLTIRKMEGPQYEQSIAEFFEEGLSPVKGTAKP